MDETSIEKILGAEREEKFFVRDLLLDYEKRMGSRRTPPKGWIYNDILEALRLSARIRAKLG